MVVVPGAMSSQFVVPLESIDHMNEDGENM